MRILVVEDDRKVAAFLERGLREEHYAVDTLPDGRDAVYQAGLNPYDVIILDIMLPGRSGFEVCRELRTRGILTPVLMLTARDGLEDKITGLTEGADDYLTKPFSFHELLARVRALMRRDQDYKSGVLEVGDLILDPVSRLVSRGGRAVALTGREYALLEYLMRNQGRILTQTDIIEHVWDRNYDGLSNIVNVYLNRLRDKIDRDGARPLIKTIRGHGYTIEDSE